MKTVALLVLVLAIVFADEAAERRERIRKNREECIRETKVDPVLIDKADRGEFSDNRELQCFAKCFYTKAGFINEKGDLLMDVIEAKIPAEHNRGKALEIINECKKLKGADVCETAYQIHKCYFERTHELIKKD